MTEVGKTEAVKRDLRDWNVPRDLAILLYLSFIFFGFHLLLGFHI